MFVVFADLAQICKVWFSSSMKFLWRFIPYIIHSLWNTTKFLFVLFLVPFAFNHWNSGVQYTTPPKYVLSIHSSNPVMTDHVVMSRYTYSDALFLMAQKLGKKHQVRLFIFLKFDFCIQKQFLRYIIWTNFVADGFYDRKFWKSPGKTLIFNLICRE